MEQNQNQNKTKEFVQKNSNYLIAAVVVVILLVGYFTTRDRTVKDASNNASSTEQTQNNSSEEGDNAKVASDNTSMTSDSKKEGDKSAMKEKSADGSMKTGSFTAKGTLQITDNPTKGNLMLASGKSKIYIATSRDFSALVGKESTLLANGTPEAFTFIGFKEADSAPVAMVDETAKGGDDSAMMKPENGGLVSFSGTLQQTDNPAKGNFLLVSGKTKVYIESKQDYHSWVDKEVTLSATGTLQSFSGVSLKLK